MAVRASIGNVTSTHLGRKLLCSSPIETRLTSSDDQARPSTMPTLGSLAFLAVLNDSVISRTIDARLISSTHLALPSSPYAILNTIMIAAQSLNSGGHVVPFVLRGICNAVLSLITRAGEEALPISRSECEWDSEKADVPSSLESKSGIGFDLKIFGLLYVRERSQSRRIWWARR